jgi:predicted metal-binding membrane protein
MAFIMTSWRDGRDGAFRMGIEHGLYCAGCCWLLFVILFPLGMLNVAAMAAITALIFAEKSLPLGRWTSRIAGGLLAAGGALIIAMPGALPTTM